MKKNRKIFRVNPTIGKVKYSISSYDGIKKHNDGSEFWDIETFKYKKDLIGAIETYIRNNYILQGININFYKFIKNL